MPPGQGSQGRSRKCLVCGPTTRVSHRLPKNLPIRPAALREQWIQESYCLLVDALSELMSFFDMEQAKKTIYCVSARFVNKVHMKYAMLIDHILSKNKLLPPAY